MKYLGSTLRAMLSVSIRLLAWNHRALWLLVGGMLLKGCATIPDNCYHCNETQPVPQNDMVIRADGWGACRTGKDGRALDCESPMKPPIPTPFHQAWMEYRESGARQEAQQVQAQAIVDWIEGGFGPLHVVVYIHGWHNNADASGNDPSRQNPKHNAAKFPFLMARVVDTLKRLELVDGKPMPQVLGIYVGWRGEKYPSGLATYLSIDGRSTAADVIGLYGDLRDDLTRIAEAVGRRPESSRLMVVGHSLGGRMLTSMFRRQLDQGNPQPLGSGSMIVTLNPAVSADCYEGVFGTNGMKDRGNPLRPRPVWINITSENDGATDWIYRCASHIGLVQGCKADSKANSEANETAIGHYGGYRNVALHAAIGPVEAPWDPGCPAIEPTWFKAWPELESQDESRRFALYFPARKDTGFITSEPGKRATVRFEPEPDSKTDNGALHRVVWNVRTDKTLIDFENDDGLDGKHNGYVGTILIRLLTEMLYADPRGSATPPTRPQGACPR